MTESRALGVQEVRPTNDSEAAAHTAAVVTELSLAMHLILQVSPSLLQLAGIDPARCAAVAKGVL